MRRSRLSCPDCDGRGIAQCPGRDNVFARSGSVGFEISDKEDIRNEAPVLQCRQCGETELENETMQRVEQVIAGVDRSSELDVIRFAA